MKKLFSLGIAASLVSLSGTSAAIELSYKELNSLAPLAIGPTYTSTIFSHSASSYFGDTLAFNIPAADVTAKVFTFEVGTAFTFFNLTGELFKGIDPVHASVASCAPSCPVGYTSLGTIGSGSNNWTSAQITLNDPGYYFIAISGYTGGTSGGNYEGSITLSPVPEATSLSMLLAGLGVVGLMAKRRLVSRG